MADGFDDEVLGKLFGLLAHDLRNPLAALHSNIGFLETIEGLDEDSREAIADGVVSCDGLAHLIDNVELLGQAIRGAAPPSSGTVALATVVDEVLAGAQPTASSHEVKLTRGDVPEVNVQADREMLRRSLTNLVRNSIQLGGTTEPVRVSGRVEGKAVTLVIEDGGGNPTGELREEVFTPAGQVKAKQDPNGRYSRGLGLLCARIAGDVAGVKVRVVDPPSGKGSAFEVEAPLA